MKIVLFSEDRFGAEVLLEILKTDDVTLVVCPYFDSNIHKRLETLCKAKHVEFYRTKNINDEYVLSKMKSENFDLLISCHCSRIISKEIFSKARLGAVNLHPSLLPKYRGMSPQHWPIINGDKETAVTIHEIRESVDTGAILKQVRVPINSDESVCDIQNKMIPIYKQAFSELLNEVKNNTVKRSEQKSTKEIYYGKFYSEYAEINLRQTKQSVKNLVRAVTHPYCGAWYKDYIIWSVSNVDEQIETQIMKRHSRCGIYKDAEGVFLRLFDGVLQIMDYSINTIWVGGVLKYSSYVSISKKLRCTA